ncbi:MAG: GNAT family N-acetyltransferase [Micropepsaceae bacterium]
MTELSSSPSDYELRTATRADKDLLESMFQFYVYDFSEFEDATSGRLSLNPQGKFDLTPQFSPYWNDPLHWAYLVYVNQSPAGFALVNTKSHAGNTIDRNMAEFFVARKYRRQGLASEVFHKILDDHPGRWEVAIINANEAAKAFWPKAIRSTPVARDLRLVEHSGQEWNGPIWTFACTPSRPTLVR